MGVRGTWIAGENAELEALPGSRGQMVCDGAGNVCVHKLPGSSDPRGTMATMVSLTLLYFLANESFHLWFVSGSNSINISQKKKKNTKKPK